MDRIIRAVAGGGLIKISAVDGRGLVQAAREIHGTTPVATAALGRTLCATAILGDMLKEDDASVTVRINGGGPIGSIIAVSDSGGNVRGYAQNPHVVVPNRPDGKLNVGMAVGKDGMLTVSRDLGLKEPYIGSTQLVSGEIAEDFTAYFAESEQIGAACGLGVLVDTDRSVLAAGGFVVQLLPGAPPELIDRLDENIRDMGSVTDILKESSVEALVGKTLAGLDPNVLDEIPVTYRCYCSRERVKEAVSSIGLDELRQIVESGESAEVGCQFCDKKYSFTSAEILDMVTGIERQKERD